MTPKKFKTKLTHVAGTEIHLHGEHFTFDKATGIGHLSTTNPLVIERLRQIPEGFTEVDDEPAPSSSKSTEAGTGDGDPPKKFVLAGPDGQTLDLATLDDSQLREFVVANQLTVHGRAKGDTLRQAIVDGLAAAAAAKG